MPDRTAPDTLNVRLPLYAYTSALWRGKRVLEIGCGEGSSAAYLAVHGAADVVSLDVDADRIDRARAQHARPGIHYLLLDNIQQIAALSHRFDVVLLPEAESVLADQNLVSRIKGLLRDDGFLVVAVAASERQSAFFRGGVGYYDLSDALTRDFRSVRMLGQTPFLGFGLIEFDTGSDGLRVDVSLLGGGTEQPSHYVAIAGNVPSPALGQALVQVPFAPIEALADAAATAPPPQSALVARPAGGVALVEAEREIARLKVEVAEARLVGGHGAGNASSTVELVAATTRADLAERRLDEVERRARARADESDTRVAELRRKLEDALVASESAVRVSRAQGDEIEELRARLRRAAEDRALGDTELGKLRRALAEADDSVLTLTRRTAEEMAVVAQRLVTGLGSAAVTGGSVGATSPAQPSGELEAKLRRAEETLARGEAEVATLTERLRGADEEIRALKRQTSEIGTRDDRIARLEGDRQDLLWRVAELEEKLRNAEQDVVAERAPPEEIAIARASRDRAIEGFHRAAAAHVNEVNRLQASVSEHEALVTELEDSLRVAEARAAAADKEATTLRRAAKELEEADRTRRGRLSELEGKLLRVERERAESATTRATAASGPRGEAGGGADAELLAKLQSAEQRAGMLEQRVLAGEEAARAVAERAGAGEEAARAAAERTSFVEQALRAAEETARAAAERTSFVEQALRAAEETARSAVERPYAPDADQVVRAAEEAVRTAEQQAAEALRAMRAAEERTAEVERSREAAVDRAVAAGERAAAAEARLFAGSPMAGLGLGMAIGSINGNGGAHGTHFVGEVSSGEIRSVIEDAEARLREEVRALGRIEETLGRAEEIVGRGPSSAELAERERTIAGKDAQLVEGRLELARIRRESETARLHLENEIADLRAKLGAGAGNEAADASLSNQLILMHSTLGNIRRRAARLRDELEGFRRRIDTLPPGALASMLEEIGDDLGEFAK